MKYLLSITKELENFNVESASVLIEQIIKDEESEVYKIERFSPEYFAYQRLLETVMVKLEPTRAT